ncbi:MAG: magnesium/cobalt transporter CorA [Bacteroidota bacterium]
MATPTENLREAARRQAELTRGEARVLLDEAGRLVQLPFRLLGRPHTRLVERRNGEMGVPAGTLVHLTDAEPATAEIRHYTPNWAETKTISKVSDAEADALAHLATGPGVTWINVNGVKDTRAIAALGDAFGLHPLVQEDLVHTTQRPKVEVYARHTFVVARMVHPRTGEVEQVAFVLGDGFLLSFQERAGDVFDAVRQRIATDGSRVRGEGADYLLYALLDVLMDAAFATVERLGDATEALEEAVLGDPGPSVRAAIAGLRREILVVRRAVWPLREVISTLIRDESPFVTEKTQVFLRDVQDHCVQAADALETLRDVLAGLSDLYLSAVSMRQNEVMKALTVIGAVFLPLTFLTGLYGMNFDRMPELHLPYAYPTFLILLALVTAFTLVYFKVKRWL